MKNSLIRCLSFALFSLASAGAFGNAFFGVNPQPGSLTFGGASNGYATVNISTNSGASYSNVLSGQFQGYFDPASEGNGLGADDFFRFFCIDLSQFADTGPNPYTRSLGVPDATDSAELTRLFDQFYPNASVGTYYSGGQTTFGNFPNTTASAAFQLAIWEIWFDTDNNLNLSSGAFRADPGTSAAVVGLAQGYLNAIGNGSIPAPGWTLYEFANPYKQDYLSVTHSQPLRQVPEPGVLLLVGAGALAAWGSSKRHRKSV
jgi:PEP-CTERM motif-containing protein